MVRALNTAMRMRQSGIDFIKLSSQYLLYGIYLGFTYIFWLIGMTSGLFGSPPAAWIETVADIGLFLVVVYAGLLGPIFIAEAILRSFEEKNDPISPLLLNTLGMFLVLALVMRVDHVLINDPRTFVTWASLFINGGIQGGVYALIALGYTLVYGILFMINFAHGEIMMFGAYGGYFGMQYLVAGGERSFEDGATLVAFILIPVVVAILSLPLERLIDGYRQRESLSFQTPDWLFTFFSVPLRFLIGLIVGYGALVGLGGYAPHIFLIVISLAGALFVLFIGMTVSMLLSILLERVAYRPLRFAPRLVPLISAIGASIFFQQVALRIFGAQRKTYPRLRILGEPFSIDLGELGVLTVSKVGVVIVLVSVLLMVLLYTIIQRTKIGRAMRAVAQDKSTAALMGINVDRVIVFTFMLGAALAGAAGVMLGLRSEKIDFKFGFTPGLKAFTAAVLGGIGSIPGAMFGGFFLGIVESIGPELLGFPDAWKNAIAFGLLVLVLIFRPSGLFGAASEVKKV